MKISNPTARKGEEMACKFLKDKGYKIIDRNFRKGYGEIDIVTIKNNTLIFVEVKTRKSTYFGTPVEQITDKKIRTLKKTCEFYKQLHPELPNKLRLDAIGVLFGSASSIIEIKHIQNIST